MIYVSSDLHFGHNREFIYAARGFQSIEEMNEAIIERFNEVITDDDDLYLLGDCMLGDNDAGLECLRRLHGRLHIVLGNHDTLVREELYRSLPNVVEVALAAKIKYQKIHFFMTHYPAITSNLEKESIYQCLINLFGHVHQKSNFYYDMPTNYHVGVDSHDCRPVLIDNIIEEIKMKANECLAFL